MKYEGNNGSVGDGKASYYSLGVVFFIGPGRLTAQYHHRNKGVNVTATSITEVTNGGGRHYTMSYKYGFSKRTYAFAFAAQVRADDGARIEGGPLGGRATAVG